MLQIYRHLTIKQKKKNRKWSKKNYGSMKENYNLNRFIVVFSFEQT